MVRNFSQEAESSSRWLPPSTAFQKDLCNRLDTNLPVCSLPLEAGPRYRRPDAGRRGLLSGPEPGAVPLSPQTSSPASFCAGEIGGRKKT